MKPARYLPLGLKVALVAASFSLPIVVLACFVVTNINSDIRFSTLELAGNAYLRPLEKLLDAVQQYELLVTASAPADAARCDELAAAIRREFANLAAVDQKFGADLQFTEEGLKKRDREHLTVERLSQHWEAIASQPKRTSVAVRTVALDQLVASLRETITHAGDTSNLILDPDLDSYYLMDVTLLALPQTQDRLAKVIAFERERLESGNLSNKDRVQLAVFAAMLAETDLARVMSSLETSLKEDANFYGASPTLLTVYDRGNKEYREQTNEFVDLLRRASVQEGPDVDPAVFIAAGWKARAASFKLWDACVDELDQLLATRVADLVMRRTVALAGSGAALAIACLLALVLTRSITKPLNALAESLGPGADLLSNSVEILSESPESADMICEELTAQAGYMRRAVQQLVAVVRGGEVSSASPLKLPGRKRSLEAAEILMR